MKHLISAMLERYETGAIDRRQLIQALAAVAVTAQAAPAASTFKGVSINHIALRVTDIPRSRDFYQKHFGMPVIREAESNCFLGLGANFLTLFKNANAGLDHFCLAIDNFKPEPVMEELKRQSMTPRRQEDRVYFPDPDGLTVQVSAVDHRA